MNETTTANKVAGNLGIANKPGRRIVTIGRWVARELDLGVDGGAPSITTSLDAGLAMPPCEVCYDGDDTAAQLPTRAYRDGGHLTWLCADCAEAGVEMDLDLVPANLAREEPALTWVVGFADYSLTVGVLVYDARGDLVSDAHVEVAAWEQGPVLDAVRGLATRAGAPDAAGAVRAADRLGGMLRWW